MRNTLSHLGHLTNVPFLLMFKSDSKNWIVGRAFTTAFGTLALEAPTLRSCFFRLGMLMITRCCGCLFQGNASDNFCQCPPLILMLFINIYLCVWLFINIYLCVCYLLTFICVYVNNIYLCMLLTFICVYVLTFICVYVIIKKHSRNGHEVQRKAPHGLFPVIPSATGL